MQINWLEVKRKSFHIIAGIIIVALLNFDIINLNWLLLLLAIAVISSLIAKFYPHSFFNWFLDHLDRDHDRYSLPGRGSITYLIGIVLALSLFEKDIALAAILIMVIGDAVGPLVGMHFAKTKHILNQKKLVEGTIAGVIAATIAAWVFVNFFEALLGSIVGMVVETIEFKYFKKSFLDDNITIPVVSGFIIYLLSLL